MLICGAGGHARELYHCFREELDKVYFFDNINSITKIGEIPVLNTLEEVKELFKIDNKFILGVGGVKPRSFLYRQMVQAGGIHFSVRARSINDISSNQMIESADIFPYSFIGPNIKIGIGTLINTRSNIHHDTIIGKFCDIAPSVTILGGAVIGNNSFIGSGSTILPKVKIGDNVIIGAGSVVISDIASNVVAVGSPARIIKYLNIEGN